MQEKYLITKDGKVYRRSKGALIEVAQYTDRYGYKAVTIFLDGVKKNRTVHRLVAEFYLGKDPRQINHKDGDKKNNNLDNLEYVTPGENLLHAYRLGLKNATGSRNGKSKLVESQVLEIRKLLSEGTPQKVISALYSIDQSTVSNIKTRKLWNTL